MDFFLLFFPSSLNCIPLMYFCGLCGIKWSSPLSEWPWWEREQETEQHMCDGRGNYGPRTQPVIYQWNITPRICVKACALGIYDMCSPLWGRTRLITPSPLSQFNLLCPRGILQFPRHPWPNTEMLQRRLDISAPLMEGKKHKSPLGHENGQNEILNTSDNTIFLFTPL